MRRRRLGRSSLEVPVVVFGAWAAGGWAWGGVDEDEVVRAMQASIDAGADAIDTAPVYGFGLSERLVGRAIRGRRDQVVVMTKLGLRWDDEHGALWFETTDQDGVARAVRRDARPESALHEVRRSLARLGVERIDLLQVHWPDAATPIEDTIGALLELRRSGEVREIGLSNHGPDLMRRAQATLGDAPLASNQPKYSLLAREIEAELLPWCRDEDVGVLAYSPLEQGLLSGCAPASRKFDKSDGRHRRPTFEDANRAKVNSVVESTLRPIAEARGATCAQVALAWVVAQPGVTAAIAGARSVAQARENAQAGDLELTPTESARLRAAFGALELGAAARGGWWSRLRRWLRSV